MQLDRQRGSLSLGWSMMLFGALVALVLTVLLSFGFERNLFAEGWQRLMQAAQGAPSWRQSTQALERGLQPDAAAIRKCIVNGKVTYSNVACEKEKPVSRKRDSSPG